MDEEKFQEQCRSQCSQTLIQCKPDMSDKDFIKMLKDKIAHDFKQTQKEDATETSIQGWPKATYFGDTVRLSWNDVSF